MENLADTTYEELQEQKNINIKGLYFLNNGEKKEPRRIYFGISFSQRGLKGGEAFIHYDNALRPVYKENGERFVIPNLRNVSAKYSNGVIKDFYIE